MSFDYAGQPKPAHLQSETEFDAWLTEHDREVKAAAWDEGNAVGYADGIGDTSRNTLMGQTNPYR